MQHLIHWPRRFHPDVAPIHIKNELHTSATPEQVWVSLIKARHWPRWYPNAKRVMTGDADLNADSIFHWTTFGVRLKSVVAEFIPNERIAWSAKGLGVDVYHAWLIEKTPNGCKITTEETQYGWACKLSHKIWPKRMYKQHQIWLEKLSQKASEVTTS